MSNAKSSTECRKPHVVELDITHGLKDGGMVTVCLADKIEKPQPQENSGSHVSSRSTSSPGMTRFEAAREAARAWNNRTESSRRVYSSPASQESVRSTRSAPALIRTKVLAPLRLHRRISSRGRSSSTRLEDYNQRTNGPVSDSEESRSSTDQGALRSRFSKQRKNRGNRHPSLSRDHACHHEDQGETQCSSTPVDSETSGNARGKGIKNSNCFQSPFLHEPIEMKTKTARSPGSQVKSSSTVCPNPEPNKFHTIFPGCMQQPQYYQHVDIPVAQQVLMGSGPPPTYGLGQPPSHGITNGHCIYYLHPGCPYQVPLFSPSAVIQPNTGDSQTQIPQFQTSTASQAAQAAALTAAPNVGNLSVTPNSGTHGSRAPQFQAPQFVVYTTTATSSGSSTTVTPLVSPTYSVDASQPSDSTVVTSTEDGPKDRKRTGDEKLGMKSLDSEVAPQSESMGSGGVADSGATGYVHGRLLGPLSKHYFCFGCGRVRSKKFHRQNPLQKDQDPGTNYCANCRREHAKKAARHLPGTALSSASPEIIMPESSSIGSASQMSHSDLVKYPSLRENLTGLLPGTPTRKSTVRETSKSLYGSPERSRLRSDPRCSFPRLITPPRHIQAGFGGAKAGFGLRRGHSHGYRPPSVESVIDSSLEPANPKKFPGHSRGILGMDESLLSTPRRQQPGSEIRGRLGDDFDENMKETCLGLRKHRDPQEQANGHCHTSGREPKQVRFDRRLEEWFSQSSQVNADESVYYQDWPDQEELERVESHQDTGNETAVDNGLAKVSKEILSDKRVVFHDDTSDVERETDEEADYDDDDDDDDDPFTIPVRTRKPRLFPVTTRALVDESVVSSVKEAKSPTPVPRFRSVSDHGSPLRGFSEKLAVTAEYEAVPAPVPNSAFQFRAKGPYNYSSLPPAPASAPPMRKGFYFSSLADDPWDESDSFYSHSVSDWELEQRFQELNCAGSWNDYDAQEEQLFDMAEYGEVGSEMLEK